GVARRGNAIGARSGDDDDETLARDLAFKDGVLLCELLCGGELIELEHDLEAGELGHRSERGAEIGLERGERHRGNQAAFCRLIRRVPEVSQARRVSSAPLPTSTGSRGPV